MENELGRNAVEEMNMPVERVMKKRKRRPIEGPYCLVTPLGDGGEIRHHICIIQQFLVLKSEKEN